MTYRKERDRNPLGVGRWSWMKRKVKVPRSAAYGLYHTRIEIKESRRTIRDDDVHFPMYQSSR
ncbi:hypothetical protein V1502_06585 [Bacillus sp. SCS-153A]|uniref:hypothetical protein n=1 Tax=Rossellomorea sedimentorum TaxID=3115294 RepID=UPI003905DABD